MGYPNFGKVKTIVLPVFHEDLDEDEYFEKCGIRLSEIFTAELDEDSGTISIKVKNGDSTFILFASPLYGLLPPNRLNDGPWEEGVDDGYSSIWNDLDDSGDITAVIEMNDEFKIENVKFKYSMH